MAPNWSNSQDVLLYPGESENLPVKQPTMRTTALQAVHKKNRQTENEHVDVSIQWNPESEHSLQMMAKHLANYLKPKKPAW